MKGLLLIPGILLFTACNAGTTDNEHSAIKEDFEVSNVAEDTLADAIFEEAAKEKEKAPTPDTTCYVLTEGEGNRNVNAVRIIQLGDKITGELKYITFGEKPAAGQLEGTIKDGIITADWTFINDSKYFKVPVSFKVTKKALLQKPTAVNDEGQPYIPEDGEYTYEFLKVGCEYYPE